MVNIEDQVEVAEEVSACKTGAVLVELENMAIDGRQVVFDVLKSILSDTGVKVSPGMFSRHCIDSSLSQFLPELLDYAQKKRTVEDKLLAEIEKGIKYSLTDGKVKMKPEVKKLIKAAKDRSLEVGYLSSSNEETASQLLGKVGLNGKADNLRPCFCDQQGGASQDGWLKLAKKISVCPSLCVVLATSSASCKSAMSSGMRCVVVPDKFTTFNDFGGADFVLDALDEPAIERVFKLLE